MDTAKAARRLMLGSLATSMADTLGGGGRSTFKDEKKVHTSRTLYICSVPHHVDGDELQAPFKACEGFICLRRVRGMAFVDFKTKQEATNAIGKCQGHKYRGKGTGLLISYDKDDGEDIGGSSRRRLEELRRAKEQLESSYVRHFCSACGTYCVKLTCPLNNLPTRKTDNSRVIGDGHLITLDMAKGAAKKIKREKGIEKQYRMNCMACDIPLAYRSVPHGKQSKYLFLIAGAVSLTKRRIFVSNPPALTNGRAGAIPKTVAGGAAGTIRTQPADSKRKQPDTGLATAAAGAAGDAAVPTAAPKPSERELPVWLQPRGTNSLTIKAYVELKQRRDCVTQVGVNDLNVALTASAHGRAANETASAVVAKAIGVDPRKVKVIEGYVSQDKLILVGTELDGAEVLARLIAGSDKPPADENDSD